MDQNKFHERPLPIEALKHHICWVLKIDESLMNDNDKRLLQQHVDKILDNSSAYNLHANTADYLMLHQNEMETDFVDARTARVIMQKKDILLENVKKQHIENDVKPLLQIDMNRLRDDRERCKYMNEAHKRIHTVALIINDYQNVCNFLKENKNQPYSFETVAKIVRLKEYHVDRQLYSFDVKLHEDVVQFCNLVIKPEATRFREYEMQR